MTNEMERMEQELEELEKVSGGDGVGTFYLDEEEEGGATGGW